MQQNKEVIDRESTEKQTENANQSIDFYRCHSNPLQSTKKGAKTGNTQILSNLNN